MTAKQLPNAFLAGCKRLVISMDVITPEPDPKKPDVKPGMHLYGAPVTDAKWLKDAGDQGEVLYAFVLPRAPQVDAAKQVLRSMIGK